MAVKAKTLPQLFDLCDKHIEGVYRIQLFRKEGKKRIPTGIVWRVSSQSIKSLTHFEADGKHRFEGKTIHKAMDRFFNYLKKRKLI